MPFTRKELLSYNSRIPILERLNNKSIFDSNGCQVYTGVLDRCGYGVIKVGGRNLGAHKVMYILAVCDFDQSKYEILHRCHNRSCVNPDHLRHGTHKENMREAVARGSMVNCGRGDIDTSGYLGSGGCGYRVCAEGDDACLLFETTTEAESLGFKSAYISTSRSRGCKYKGYTWKYIKKYSDKV